MNPTPDDMNERILKRFAKRLLRCPFDEELFDSKEVLSGHLLELHFADICRRQRMPKQEAHGDIDRPSKLTFCGHCFGYMVPDALGRNALTEIDRHIREAHPNPNGPAVITMSFSSDSALIDQFLEDQVSPEVCVCSEPGCGELFNAEASVAEHWVENHCYRPSIEDVRKLLEVDPERFEAVLEECLKAEHDHEQTRLRQTPDPEDGYLIRHQPLVPRVRSRPSECIVYIEGEKSTLHREDYEEMLAEDGYDWPDYEHSGEPWPHQTVRLELRFMNIQDGYVSLVADLNHPPLRDASTIEVSWQDEPAVFFPCTVNKSKRAIYNLDGKLKQAFAGLPSGVVLYITSVGHLRYEFRLKAKVHTVPNCKVFVRTGENRWRAETQNLELQWETGEAVCRHQSTFDEMDALHEEARQTGLSVRDAVYEYMREMAKDTTVSIKEVYDFVFWLMRTCSRAAVWSQFRKEHACYVRVGPGLYRFDESKPFPKVRVVHAPTADVRQPAELVVAGERGPNTRISILIRWSVILNQSCPDQVIKFRDAGKTQAHFLASLFSAFGLEHAVARRLIHLRMNRSFTLSRNPADFVNQATGEAYRSKQVPGTSLFLCTQSSTLEKAETIRRIVRELGFHSNCVEVTEERIPTLAEEFAAL